MKTRSPRAIHSSPVSRTGGWMTCAARRRRKPVLPQREHLRARAAPEPMPCEVAAPKLTPHRLHGRIIERFADPQTHRTGGLATRMWLSAKLVDMT